MNGSYEIEFKGRGKKQNGVRGDKHPGVGNTGKCSQSLFASSPTLLLSRFMEPGTFPRRKETEN